MLIAVEPAGKFKNVVKKYELYLSDEPLQG